MPTSQRNPSGRVGRPTRAQASELESRIRGAALDQFLAEGYGGTTMESVARAAGTTKRTLYAHHPDKQALFLDVVHWALDRQRWAPQVDPDGDDLRSALVEVARAAVARAVDPELQRLFGMVATEARRFPELVRNTDSWAWSPRVQAIADVLRRFQDRGDLDLADVDVAAEQFFVLVTGVPQRLATFGAARSPAAEERDLQLAVTLFLDGARTRAPGR